MDIGKGKVTFWFVISQMITNGWWAFAMWPTVIGSDGTPCISPLIILRILLTVAVFVTGMVYVMVNWNEDS